jgi:hypothetical protein
VLAVVVVVVCLGLQVTRVRVADGGLFKLEEPDPEWRNEADCGEATFRRPDDSIVPLNCAGPRHSYFRCATMEPYQEGGCRKGGGAGDGRRVLLCWATLHLTLLKLAALRRVSNTNAWQLLL